ncbi:predicted protein [Coccidioides posadasii str. Silveira]|uniref:Predicted protein n=2 Tax=Coccidioides posadasii TaxID=199306 RepID=E9CYS9_COCPS|nr:predicted protein [Coccidioides posadasii str. Silveira]KMM66677.1 hypothetical protein CPAG_03015 [Coccidioides posadasii RMSCC 3488]
MAISALLYGVLSTLNAGHKTNKIIFILMHLNCLRPTRVFTPVARALFCHYRDRVFLAFRILLGFLSSVTGILQCPCNLNPSRVIWHRYSSSASYGITGSKIWRYYKVRSGPFVGMKLKTWDGYNSCHFF